MHVGFVLNVHYQDVKTEMHILHLKEIKYIGRSPSGEKVTWITIETVNNDARHRR